MDIAETMREVGRRLDSGLEVMRMDATYQEALEGLGKSVARYGAQVSPDRETAGSWTWQRQGRNSVWVRNAAEEAQRINDGYAVTENGADGKRRTVGLVQGRHMLEKALETAGNRDMAEAVDRVLTELERGMDWQ